MVEIILNVADRRSDDGIRMKYCAIPTFQYRLRKRKHKPIARVSFTCNMLPRLAVE